MELYNRMMDSDFARELLEKKDYLFLRAKSKKALECEEETRGERAKEILRPSKCCEIEYYYNGISSEGKIDDGFIVESVDGIAKDFGSLRKGDMYAFLSEINMVSNNLVVDFTLINNRFLGSFCALLNLFKWNEIYFCYTEPGRYCKNNNDSFELKNSTKGYEQIPNLETFSDSSSECDWVIFLGFEGSRIRKLEDEAPSTRRYALPHMSIPSMQTHWHNYAIDANRDFFELKRNNQERIDYVSAINPFETYDKLTKLKYNNSNVRLVISPIGPKPVMLGCIMYVLENENEMILFDNPLQEGSNSIEYGVTHFYDLSEFVHIVKNKRFIEEDE